MSTKRYGLLTKCLTADRVRRMYLEDLLTDEEIGKVLAEELEVPPFTGEAVAKARRKMGIRAITSRQRRELREGWEGPSLDGLTPAKLRDLYVKMGDAQIAKMYGVQKPAIRRLRRKWGIESLDKATRHTSCVELTEEQKDVLLGSLLGDGHLLARGVFKVGHAFHQYEYITNLHHMLTGLARPLRYEEKKMRGTGENRASFVFSTAPHVWLKSLRKAFYPQGRKIFPREFLMGLSDLSLAIWFFDDGTLRHHSPEFAVGDVDEESVENAMEALRSKFGLQVMRSPYSTETCTSIRVLPGSAGMFFKRVAPFATSDLLHKIPPRFWPRGMTPRSRVRSFERVRFPKELRARCGEGGEDLVEDIKAFWREDGHFPYHTPRPEDLQTLARLEVHHVLQEGCLKPRQVGQSSCQAFMPHIWDAYNTSSNQSPRQRFHDDVWLDRCVRSLLSRGLVPHASNMRTEMRFPAVGVFSFRPSAAKVLVDQYCRTGGVVWDPCGGWGGRMMGSLLSSARISRYVACEPSTRTYQGLLDLASWMDRAFPVSGRVELHNVPAEEFDPPSRVDVVMTSPPYWRCEHYADETTQSSARYGTYEDWLEGFWRVVLEKAVQALGPGGWLLLNVDDFKVRGRSYALVKDTTKIVRGLGLGDPDRISYMMPTPKDPSNHEPVLVWCKGTSMVEAPRELLSVEAMPSSPSPGVRGQCVECGEAFLASRTSRRYCSDTCSARGRRRAKAKKKHRQTSCGACHEVFEIPLTGGVPKYCGVCKVEREASQDLSRRTKMCAYRHCRREFVDYSPKNVQKFCHEEHRRREKLLRLGKATSVEDFRKPDPVLEE